MGHCRLDPTLVSIVFHDLSFPDQPCAILAQSSKMLPVGTNPLLSVSLGLLETRVLAMGSTNFLALASDFLCSLSP